MTDVRPFRETDHAAVRAVAEACDETGPVSASDPRYLAHVASRGRVVVSEDAGEVVAYGGALDGSGATYLTDLFVRPGARDAGHGSAVLEVLWSGSTARATSASQDPRALSSYARYGAVPRWPLVRLTLPGADVRPQVPVVRSPARTGDAGWSYGLDGVETVQVLAGPGDVATTAVVRVDGGEWQVLRATTPDPRGLAVLVAELRRLAGPAGAVGLAVPGPHPALGDLLAAGARIGDVDLWCASLDAADLVDPTRELPSPALG